jgi:hypothetical protein
MSDVKDLRDKDIIAEYLQYVDEHYNECKGNASRYKASDSLLRYPRGTEGAEEKFLIVDSWDFIREFNEWANKNYGKELYEETGYELPGDEDTKKYFTNWLNYLTQDMWGFGDEYAVCDCCYKVIRTSPDSYSWKADYWIDYELTCGDCTRENENIRDEYLHTLQNNFKTANTILSDEDLKEAGYERLEHTIYQNGWYGVRDDPEELLKEAQSKYPEGIFVFSICGVGQFHTDFDLWVLTESIETENDEDDERLGVKTIKFKFFDEEIEVRFVKAHYFNGNLFVGAEHYEEEYECYESWCDVTVNLPGMGCEPNEAFLDVNNCPWELITELKKKGYIKDTGITRQSGFCTYPLVEFSEEFLNEIIDLENENEE